MTLSESLKKREIKYDTKIAAAIAKMKRSHSQMSFYNSMNKNVKKHIQNTIVQ